MSSGLRTAQMNIYDIAKEAGVSIATVSRVVNGSSKVSEKTKSKVLKIIKDAGYTPNIFAKGLGLDSMQTIGILVPDISDMYMAMAVSHLEKMLHAYGYDMILGCSGYSAESKEDHIRLLLDKRIDALLLVGSTYAGSDNKKHNTSYIKEAAEEKPVFLINGILTGKNIYCTGSDDRKAVYDATIRLINDGRKKILFLTDSMSYSANKKRSGYMDALKDSGIGVSDDMIINTRNDIHHVRDMLKSREGSFDAVVATEDGMAIGAVKYVLGMGLSVPGDVSVIGYNNSNLCVASVPELTSVDNRLEDVCRCTVDRMIKVLNGEKNVRKKIIFDCDLVERDTTDL
mgnify:CR=1 FL=1